MRTLFRLIVRLFWGLLLVSALGIWLVRVKQQALLVDHASNYAWVLLRLALAQLDGLPAPVELLLAPRRIRVVPAQVLEVGVIYGLFDGESLIGTELKQALQ